MKYISTSEAAEKCLGSVKLTPRFYIFYILTTVKTLIFREVSRFLHKNIAITSLLPYN